MDASVHSKSCDALGPLLYRPLQWIRQLLVQEYMNEHLPEPGDFYGAFNIISKTSFDDRLSEIAIM